MESNWPKGFAEERMHKGELLWREKGQTEVWKVSKAEAQISGFEKFFVITVTLMK